MLIKIWMPIFFGKKKIIKNKFKLVDNSIFQNKCRVNKDKFKKRSVLVLILIEEI